MSEALRQIMGEHAGELARYSSASINKILSLLRKSEVRIATDLSGLLATMTETERQLVLAGRFTGPGGEKIRRLQRLKEQIQELAANYRKTANEIIRADGRDLVESEIEFIQTALINFAEVGAGVSASQVYAAAVKNPFEGRLLREYTRSLEAGVRQTMLESIRIGSVSYTHLTLPTICSV